MTPTATEWVEQAENDFEDANKLMRHRKRLKFDNVCYLFHQCAEKYFKARLQEADIRFERTHNLPTLLKACLPVEPMWEILSDHARSLNRFGSDIRYPGASADKEMAKEAFHACDTIRTVIRESLKLD
jgi:HEPN domain-containing protein